MPQPVCQEFQAQVLKCYQENPTDILNCSALVNAFTACVNRARVVSNHIFVRKDVFFFLTPNTFCRRDDSYLIFFCGIYLPIQLHHFCQLGIFAYFCLPILQLTLLSNENTCVFGFSILQLTLLSTDDT